MGMAPKVILRKPCKGLVVAKIRRAKKLEHPQSIHQRLCVLALGSLVAKAWEWDKQRLRPADNYRGIMAPGWYFGNCYELVRQNLFFDHQQQYLHPRI